MRVDRDAEYAKLRAAIPRPARDSNGRAVDPTEQSALVRFDAIQRHIRGGRTFEEAVAYYDRPQGVCPCGKPARSRKGRICYDCYLAAMTRRMKAYRKEEKQAGARLVVSNGRPCACGCGVMVFGLAQKRTPECAARHKAAQDRERQRLRYVAKKPAPPPAPPKKPATRREPEFSEPVKPVDVSGYTVVRVPSFARPGLRNLFGDDQGRCWSAAD